MARTEIFSGICGFTTVVVAQQKEQRKVTLEISSDCPHVTALAEQLKEVDPFREITYRRAMPQTLELAARLLPHPCCPVPAGIIKAVEVAAKLALPADVTIKVSAEDKA